MPTLREAERGLARAVITGDTSAAARMIAPGRISAEAAIGIYRNTFIGAATKALKLSYPAIELLTGEDFFAAAADVFIAEFPPASGCLDDYGANFAEFLSRFEPAAGLRYLPDVARLEWAVNIALHAEDAESAGTAALAGAAGIAPSRLLLQPHPSVSLLQTQYPADAIWRAVLARDDAALSAVPLSGGPFFLVIARGSDGLEVRRIDEPEWRFASALCAGDSFGAAFDAAPSEGAPAWVAEWFASGRFVSCREISG